MIRCPQCGNIVSYSSYFGAYICDECSWEKTVRGKGADAPAVEAYASAPRDKEFQPASNALEN